ncbi:MAG TPA: protein-glutamate O-methyltransferase CheR [Anaerolineales bacterium]|nr:protein-glutamate O-methyltransferase CheR [Anaerolineales bacterium]
MDTDVYTEIKASIKQRLKIDLTNYKDEQMKRRLDSWLVRTHAGNWNEYLNLLAKDAKELERFRNYLTINVTEFFRDANRWDTLRRDILPPLFESSPNSKLAGGLKLWSAGCSIGAEAYTLAMLMAEVSPAKNYSLLATDLDRGALAKARAGGPYSAEDVRNLDAVQSRKYLTAAAPYYVNESLKKRIRFEEQDLLADRFESGFDLIVCRNVVIYFTAEAKETLYKKFCAALRPGGVLFLGGTEIISGPANYGFQNFGISFYRRVEKND